MNFRRLRISDFQFFLWRYVGTHVSHLCTAILNVQLILLARVLSRHDENIDVIKIVLVNRRITVSEVAEDLNISIGSCYSSFTSDLDMTRFAAKLVPKLLNWKLPHEPRPKSKEELNKITKNDFLKCFEDWKKVLAHVYKIWWGLL